MIVPLSNPSEVLLIELEAIAVAVAMDAARFVALHRPATGGVLSKSSSTDLVTDVDRASERRLVAAIHRHRPQDAVLGEEGGDHAGAAVSDQQDPEQVVQWVIDPIDGTVNFVLGLPMYAISVAARLGRRTVAGCVVDVVRGECFHARLGGGAFVDTPGVDGLDPERRLRSDPSTVSTTLTGPRSVVLADAVIGTGFAYDRAGRARQGAVVAELLPRVGNVRRLGSAALDLCYVAAGRLDGYYEAGLAEWDRAAGLLIAREAQVRTAEATPRGKSAVVVAGVELFDELNALLSKLGAADVLSESE